MPKGPAALHFTGDPEADTLLAADPLALLIGFALDQQVTVQKAFSSPLELSNRLAPIAARVPDPPLFLSKHAVEAIGGCEAKYLHDDLAPTFAGLGLSDDAGKIKFTFAPGTTTATFDITVLTDGLPADPNFPVANGLADRLGWPIRRRHHSAC